MSPILHGFCDGWQEQSKRARRRRGIIL